MLKQRLEQVSRCFTPRARLSLDRNNLTDFTSDGVCRILRGAGGLGKLDHLQLEPEWVQDLLHP